MDETKNPPPSQSPSQPPQGGGARPTDFVAEPRASAETAVAANGKKGRLGKVVALLLLVLLAAAGYAFYLGVSHENIKMGNTPIIAPPPDSAAKTRPEDPGGMKIPDQDKLVFNLLEDGDKGEENVHKPTAPIPVAPIPPKPVAKPLVKPMAKPMAKPAVKPPVKPMAKPVAKPLVKPMAKPVVKPVAKPPMKPMVKPMAKPAVKPVAKPPMKPKPKVRSARATTQPPPEVSMRASTGAIGRTPASSPPKPVAAPVLEMSVKRSVPEPTIGFNANNRRVINHPPGGRIIDNLFAASPAIPHPVTPPPPPEKTAQKTAQKTAKATNNGGDNWWVQIASLRSNSIALKEYRRLSAKLPMLAGYDRRIMVTDLPAKGTYHRLQVGGFNGKKAARAFCARLKRAGGKCIIAKP